MAEIRPFGTENSHPLTQADVRHVQVSTIQLPTASVVGMSREALAERFQGVPLLINQPIGVFALFFDPHGQIHEHAASYPIVFIVIGGEGYVRVGGQQAQAMKVHAGYAVLWPANILHQAWTTDQSMQAITVEYAAE